MTFTQSAEMLEFFGVNATSIALQGAVLHICHLMLSPIPHFFKPERLLYRPAGINYNNLSVPIQKEISLAFSESPRLLKSAFFNARSVNNKAVTLSDIIVENKMDILCLVETWHKQSDGLLFNELTPAGYGLFDLPRSSGRGGGIIVLYNQQYSLSPVAAPLFN